ncbi:MAG: glycine zipper domain-containing protein [bacterium]
MNYRNLASTAVLSGVFLTGCYTPDGQPDRTANGALIGGALGAGTGALIGNASGHHTAEGAAIGGAVGLLTGALVGNAMEQQHREALRAQAPQTLVRVEQGQPLATADVKALAKAGLSDDVIISQIRNSHSVYHLSTAEIIDLKDSGTSQTVIDYMINTAANAVPTPVPGTVVTEAPPSTVYQEVIYPAPGPDYVWVGGYWTWYGGRWCWARGHWAYPPHRGAYWQGGHWDHRGSSHVWVGGYWR